jgi:uncharacterized protein with LGFP repeats
VNSKTKTALIIVCVIGFLLTSTFTWGIIAWSAQQSADLAAATVKTGIGAGEQAREYTGWSITWILAHANALVPVFFLGFLVWLVMQKKTDHTSASLQSKPKV